MCKRFVNIRGDSHKETDCHRLDEGRPQHWREADKTQGPQEDFVKGLAREGTVEEAEKL